MVLQIMSYKNISCYHEFYSYNSLCRYSQILPLIKVMSTSMTERGSQGGTNKAFLRKDVFMCQKKAFDNLLRPPMPDFEVPKGRFDPLPHLWNNCCCRGVLQLGNLSPGIGTSILYCMNNTALSKRQLSQDGGNFAILTSSGWLVVSRGWLIIVHRNNFFYYY